MDINSILNLELWHLTVVRDDGTLWPRTDWHVVALTPYTGGGAG